MVDSNFERHAVAQFPNAFAAMSHYHWLLNRELDYGEDEEDRFVIAGKFYEEHIASKYPEDEILLANLLVFSDADDDLYNIKNDKQK